jgi:hypothetical protein
MRRSALDSRGGGGGGETKVPSIKARFHPFGGGQGTPSFARLALLHPPLGDRRSIISFSVRRVTGLRYPPRLKKKRPTLPTTFFFHHRFCGWTVNSRVPPVLEGISYPTSLFAVFRCSGGASVPSWEYRGQRPCGFWRCEIPIEYLDLMRRPCESGAFFMRPTPDRFPRPEK